MLIFSAKTTYRECLSASQGCECTEIGNAGNIFRATPNQDKNIIGNLPTRNIRNLSKVNTGE